MQNTITHEFANADIGDERLNQRLVKIGFELGSRPNDSIPASTSGRAEMEAVYRFCDNPKVTPEKILQPHVNATLDRIRQCETVVLVQDTTELDLTRPERKVVGAGKLGSGQRKGAKLHPLISFTPEGLCLGTAWHKTFVTEDNQPQRSPQEKAKRRRSLPIEEKESYRWLEGLRAAREVAANCPETRCVCIADSEADIYEMFSESRGTGDTEVHLLIRGCQTRSSSESNWLEEVRQTECVYVDTISVSKRISKIKANKNKREQSRDARQASVSVRASQVTLLPPERSGLKLPAVTLNVVLAEEEDPPAGEIPVQWLLVTSLPIDHVQSVEEIVSLYQARWQIEVFFKTLKSGCRVEERQFRTLPRVCNCVAIYLVIAWRTNYLCYLGRECPDMNCEVVFSKSEWQSVSMIVAGELPEQPPTLNEVIRQIASLGGYVLRKKTNPGPMTLWQGLQRAYDFSIAWDCFIEKYKK